MKPENRKSTKLLIKEHLHEMSQEVRDLLNEPDDFSFDDDFNEWYSDHQNDYDPRDNQYDDWLYGTYDDDYVSDGWEPDDWSPMYSPRPQPVEVEGTPLGELLRSINHAV